MGSCGGALIFRILIPQTSQFESLVGPSITVLLDRLEMVLYSLGTW